MAENRTCDQQSVYKICLCVQVRQVHRYMMHENGSAEMHGQKQINIILWPFLSGSNKFSLCGRKRIQVWLKVRVPKEEIQPK